MSGSNRRTVLKGIGAGTAALLGGVGVAGAAGDGERAGASAEATIFDIAEGSGNFDIFELALEETGLDKVLDSNDDQYTVFAPTDAAFTKLLDALEISASELLARDDLATILLYHVTEGRRYAASVVNAPEIEMLNGGTVTVGENGLSPTFLGDPANINATNIEASNGVIHVIDGVLNPL